MFEQTHPRTRVVAGEGAHRRLPEVLADLCAVVAKTCRRNKRTKPGTFELLNDVSLLDFSLN